MTNKTTQQPVSYDMKGLLRFLTNGSGGCKGFDTDGIRIIPIYDKEPESEDEVDRAIRILSECAPSPADELAEVVEDIKTTYLSAEIGGCGLLITGDMITRFKAGLARQTKHDEAVAKLIYEIRELADDNWAEVYKAIEAVEKA